MNDTIGMAPREIGVLFFWVLFFGAIRAGAPR
jgi:hypothetical protein